MLIAASSPPAGGAPIDQVAIATGFATVTTAILLWLLQGHRSGRSSILGRVAAFSARVGRIPSWAALPSAVATGSLLLALFGVTWDVSIHIDKGRDPGPLANPAHYFILVGLYGIFAAGLLAMSLPSDDEQRDGDQPAHPRRDSGRRRADAAVLELRPARLPARRRLAPPVRPGRDPL